MLHSKRNWSIAPVATAEELAQKLVHYTWTGCQAFQLAHYLFANDSTSAGGTQEYAVLKASSDGSELVQIESITFSWCTEVKALELILQILSGEFDSIAYATVSRSRLCPVSEHGVCELCA